MPCAMSDRTTASPPLISGIFLSPPGVHVHDASRRRAAAHWRCPEGTASWAFRRGGGPRVLDHPPDRVRRRWHLDVAYAVPGERIHDGADDDGGRRRSAAFAAGLDAERIGR